MFYVYQYVDPRTGLPFYVGKGTKDRKNVHINESADTTINIRKFHKIQSIKRSGLKPIIEIVANFETEVDAYDFESKLIRQYGRKGIDPNGILTNLTIDNRPPSQKGRIWTAEQKAEHKIRMQQIANNRTYMSRDPWNKGVTGLQTAWNKGLSGIKGNPHTEETKQLLKAKAIGKVKTDETRARMSASMKGRIPWNKGRSTPNVNPRSIRCIFISPELIEYRYNSVREGCVIHKLPTNKMSLVINGKLLNYKGWTVIKDVGDDR